MHMQRAKVVAVVAVARNGAIGLNNAMPWHLPEDLKRFKAITQGHPVVMGRKTYDSILGQLGRPLPGRPHFVITRQTDWRPLPEHDGQVVRAASVVDAVAAAQAQEGPAVMLVGGAEVYRQALETGLIDRIELTLVNSEPQADAFFPLEQLRNAEVWHWEPSGRGESFEFWTLNRRQQS